GVERTETDTASDAPDAHAIARPFADIDPADHVGIDVSLVAVADVAPIGARALACAVDRHVDAAHALQAADVGIDRGSDAIARVDDARRIEEYVAGGGRRHAVELLA